MLLLCSSDPSLRPVPTQKQTQTISARPEDGTGNHLGEVPHFHRPAEHPKTIPWPWTRWYAALRATRPRGCKKGLFKWEWAHGCKGLDEIIEHLHYLLLSQRSSPLPLHGYKIGRWFSQAQKRALKFQMVNTDYSHTVSIIVVVKGRGRIKCKRIAESMSWSLFTCT